MNKTGLSEADIRTKFITPAITAAGWDPMTQFREELQLTAGRVTVRGNIARRVDELMALCDQLAKITTKRNERADLLLERVLGTG